MTTPYALLQAAAGRDAARPFVTFYDDATGERVELSVATFANWVAKTANLLQDGLAVEPGERIGLALPVHWQAPVLLVACWAVGAVAVPVPADAPGPAGLAAAFVAGDRLGRVDAGQVLGLSLRPLGAPMAEVPAGVLDYAVEVPSYGDRFTAYAAVGADDAALDLGAGVLSQRDVVALARDSASDHGWVPGARLLSTRPLDHGLGIAAGLAAPLGLDGSVVLCRNLDPAGLERRLAVERVTAGPC